MSRLNPLAPKHRPRRRFDRDPPLAPLPPHEADDHPHAVDLDDAGLAVAVPVDADAGGGYGGGTPHVSGGRLHWGAGSRPGLLGSDNENKLCLGWRLFPQPSGEDSGREGTMPPATVADAPSWQPVGPVTCVGPVANPRHRNATVANVGDVGAEPEPVVGRRRDHRLLPPTLAEDAMIAEMAPLMASGRVGQAAMTDASRRSTGTLRAASAPDCAPPCARSPALAVFSWGVRFPCTSAIFYAPAAREVTVARSMPAEGGDSTGNRFCLRHVSGRPAANRLAEGGIAQA